MWEGELPPQDNIFHSIGVVSASAFKEMEKAYNTTIEIEAIRKKLERLLRELDKISQKLEEFPHDPYWIRQENIVKGKMEKLQYRLEILCATFNK